MNKDGKDAGNAQLARRNSYAYMRAAAALAIVFLHTFQFNVEVFQPMGGAKIASVVVRNGMMWAVPVFVMVTGALLLEPNRKLPYDRLFSHYVLRIVALLFVCVCASRWMDEYLLGIAPAEEPLAFAGNTVVAFLTAGGWQTFWYLYLLLAIYLTLPLLRGMARGLDDAGLRYATAVLFVFQSVVPFAANMAGQQAGVYLLCYTVYPLYLALGYRMGKGAARMRLAAAWVLVGACVMGNAALTVGCFLFGWSGLIGELGLYSFPLTVVEAAGIFLLFSRMDKGQSTDTKNAGQSNARQINILLSFDRHTLAIYLLHLFYLRIALYYFSFNPYRYGVWMAAVEAAGLFLLSYLTAAVLSGVRELFAL